MDALLGTGIVGGWACDAFSIPSFRIHQINYPEIEARGRTALEASCRLVQLLVQAIEFAGEAWRRQPLALALDDAIAFTADAWTERARSLHPSV